MKIYINTQTQPPGLAASLKVSTDAEGVLRVYSANAASSVSSFKFKRGTTVPAEVVFADASAAAQVAKLRFGIKLAGRYDDLLVVAAETAERVANDDGTVSFHLKLTLDASAIDSALAVNGNSADDIEKANFISEIEWENAAGELTATETVSTVIQNNVIRGSTETAGTTAGTWTALMVIRMSWAEFSALEERNPDAIYIVPDAPDPVLEHDADEQAHAALFSSWAAQLEAAFAQALSNIGTLPDASDTIPGTVLLGSVGDTRPTAVLNAAKLRENYAEYEDATSSRGSNERHGKVLFATSKEDDTGGVYIGGSRSTRPTWTQWLTRFLWDKIRAYGNVNGVFEDYVLTPKADGSNAGDQIARKKDLAAIGLQDILTASQGVQFSTNGALTVITPTVDGCFSGLMLGDFSARLISVDAQTGAMAGFATDRSTGEVLNKVMGGPLTLGEQGNAPEHAASMAQIAALEARIAALESKA